MAVHRGSASARFLSVGAGGRVPRSSLDSPGSDAGATSFMSEAKVHLEAMSSGVIYPQQHVAALWRVWRGPPHRYPYLLLVGREIRTAIVRGIFVVSWKPGLI